MKTPSRSTTLDDFFHYHYLPHARRHKRRPDLDERFYRSYISPYLGRQKLGSIQATDVENWLADLLQKGLMESSCNRFLALLKTIFSLAVTCRVLSVSPCLAVKPFRARPPQERFLTVEEARSLKAYLCQLATQAATALLLLLLTGARKSEILNARWEDLDLTRQILTVPLSKSGKARHISLSSEACAIIRALPRQADCPWLFPGRDKRKPLQNIQDAWQKIRAKLGLGNVRIHDLRHSFASFMVLQGHTLYEVQKLLGHADPRTSMRYAHLRQEQLVLAAEDVSRLICGKGGKARKVTACGRRVKIFGSNVRVSRERRDLPVKRRFRDGCLAM